MLLGQVFSGGSRGQAGQEKSDDWFGKHFGESPKIFMSTKNILAVE